MKKFGSHLSASVALCAISLFGGIIPSAFAGGSSAFDLLNSSQKGPFAGPSQWAKEYQKTAPTAKKADDQTQLQTDTSFPTLAITYGGSDQSGVQGGGKHSVTTQKPPPQAQKVMPTQFTSEVKEGAYKNIGDINTAKLGKPDGQPNWYHVFPEMLKVTMGTPEAKAAIEDMPKLTPTQRASLTTNALEQASLASAVSSSQQFQNHPKMSHNAAKATVGAQQQELSDSAAGAGENGMATAMDAALLPLLNVANEAAGTPTSAEAPMKTYNQAIWMVQQFYKYVYIPFAVLLLLPGAVLTNMKGFLAHGIVHANNDEDGIHPFNGILRSVIAIFLIPATQLFASWCIDVGNSMTYEVAQYVQPNAMIDWVAEQNFNAPLKNAKNSLENPQFNKNSGKIGEGGEKASSVEQQGGGTRMLQMAFNLMNAAMTIGLLMMSAFQIVMACYLFLMGPIAAAFFAWPAGVGTLFRPVFANWVDAFINVALWKFWWCVVLLVMQTRLEVVGVNPNTTWEMATYTAFTVILLYVPFSPFEYKPGEMVSQIMSKAEQLKDVGASGGGKKAHK